MLSPSRARRPNLQSETTELHLLVFLIVVDNLPKISAPRQSESPRMKSAPVFVGTVDIVVGTAIGEVEPVVSGTVEVVEEFVVEVVVSTA
jgi:hypothetical protein